jgi:hypothetical protein
MFKEFCMKNVLKAFGIIALVALIVFSTAACSKKDSGGNSSGSRVVSSGGKASPTSDFNYDLTKDGKGVIIKLYTGKGGKVVIPAEIEGLPVIGLAGKAFYGETDRDYGPGRYITSVVIPASVKFIDYNCFTKIEKLTSVTIQGIGVDIRGGAFRDCINLSEFKFPDGDKVLFSGEYEGDKDVIGDNGYRSAFKGNTKLPLATRAKLKEFGFEI